jgi:hypothetical protein
VSEKEHGQPPVDRGTEVNENGGTDKVSLSVCRKGLSTDNYPVDRGTEVNQNGGTDKVSLSVSEKA